MKKNLSYIIIILAVLFTTNLYGQIGNIIPDSRLPYEDDGTTLSWTLAGYEGNIPYAEETIDVTQPPYNAAGDGVTDDTDAIRLAIAATDTSIISEILFPEGTYLIKAMFPEEGAALYLPKNIILKGAGSDSTKLKFLIGGDGHDPATNYIPHCIKISGTSSNKIENVGIEDLTIKRYNEVLNTQIYLWFTDNTFTDKVKGSNIVISNAENCWVIGVESDNPLKHHISISNSNNIEVTGCYIHDPQFTCGMGYGYGICVSNSSYSLVENNIFSKCRHSMILAAEADSNVFGYNYSREPRQTDWPTLTCKDFTGDICLHGNSSTNEPPGYTEDRPKDNLFEGNIVWQIKVDHIFGTNGKYNTFFRNRGGKYGIWLDYGGSDGRNHHQTVVNNHVKCYNWLYCILGYPRKFEPDHYFEKNTIVKKVNFWGTAYTRTWSDKKVDTVYPSSWNDDISYYYEEQPEFMCFCEWPMHPKNDTNEANRRWGLGGKLTWGRNDIYEFTTETWSGVIQLGGPGSGSDVVIPAGHCVIISPGSTVEIYPFDKLIVKGCLVAEGTENDSILFTVQDYYPGMNTNCYGISFEMTVNPGASILKHCKFEHFRSYECPYDIDEFTPNTHGGAIYVENYDNLTIDSCSFIHNTAYVGGAICLKNSNITIENSEFRDNFGDCGGAIMSSSSSPIIINNIIDNNRCVGGKDLLIQAGGGIYLDGSDSDKIYLTNNVISNNIACNAGGIAICNCNDKVVCMNNTITNNDVDYGGGGIWINTSNDIFINNIFWDNTAPQISVSSPDSATMSFYNCDIQGGIDGIDFAWVNFEGEAVNIIDADPNFIGSGDHPYAITWNTECYNNGRTPDNPADSLLEYLLPTKDPSGNPRIALDIIDIGAYEAYEPGIYVEDDELGFGDVSIENIELQTFEIQHNESASVILYVDSIKVRTYIYIDSTKTDVGGFTVEDNAFVLVPGDCFSRDITFNPELVFEDYYGEIVIYSSDPYFPEVTINLTGRGIPSEYQEVFGEINSDETWNGYIELTGDVTISNGATLTIAENSEVYNVEGCTLTLEDGTINMAGANLYLKNYSEFDIYGIITLSGGSLIEVTSGSEFRLEPGSCLYGTEHTIYVDTYTGKGYDTWVEMHEDVPNHNGNIVMIPGDRIVVNSNGRFIAYSVYGDDRITITSVGDNYYWDGIEITDGLNSYIYGCDISKINHIKLNNSMFELVSSTFSDCNQIIARNESEIELYCNTFENNRACPIVLYESDGIIAQNSIINNEGNGISIYYPPLYGSVSVNSDTIQYNNGRGVDLYNVPAMFTHNEISYNGNPDNHNSARSIGFFASGNSGGANMGGNTIENNYGIEILATRDAFPNLTFELNCFGANIIYDEYDPDGYIYFDQFLLACGGYDGNPIDVRGNDFPNINDDDFEDRFLPFYNAYIFDGEKPPEKVIYEEGIAQIADSLYESAKIKMREIVDIYPETETAKNALQWLMYLEKFSGQDYATLRSYIENIDSELYSHLERTKYNTITSTYMAEKDYYTAITRLEDVLANPPSFADSIFAYIDEGYCYLKLDEEGSKSLPVECCFKPKCFEEFSYVSQNLLDNALSASKPSVTNPQIEFELHQNYPNPVSHSTTFSFLIPANTKNAELKIYNVKGQLVKTFIPESNEKGITDNIKWDCKDENGRTLCNGIYLYKLTADKKEIVKKMVLLR
ncbi:MAG: right-handed parallel beta-helix repeat-containing protein [Candidatus Cloacimonetes bacterium]|nr:right-handed parallel beta-helix repeat-containing protein [Candidatus Cloacimonadota bacterium]